MKGYFITLLVSSVCGAVCTLLSWGGFEKYVKYIASLVCMLIILAPLKSINISEITDRAEGLTEDASTPDLYSLSADMTESQIEQYITDTIFSEFGINAVYTDIIIDWEEKEPTVKSITVALSTTDAAYTEKAREYLAQTFGGEVTVIEV